MNSWLADTVLRMTSHDPAAAFSDSGSVASTKCLAPICLAIASFDALVEMAVTSHQGQR